MRLLIIIVTFGFTMASCKRYQLEMRPFTDFELYHDNTWSTSFSIKFTQSDTVYIRQHFPSDDTTIKYNTSYFGKLTPQEKIVLDSSIRQIDFSHYGTSYQEDDATDGSTFLFYIQKDSLTKIIHIYGDSTPPELLQLGRWIADVKSSLKLIEVDSLITFQHANDPVAPVNVDLRKFTPPNAEP